jgi:CheY-like chemotaxis protein
MKILIFEKFDESYLREEEWLVALSPVSCDLDDIAIADKQSDEEIHAFLDKNKATIQQNQIVLVSLFNLSLGLQIVHHIRLTEEYKRLPILLFGNIEETEIHKQQNDLSHICYTKGTRYFLEDDLTQQGLLSTVEESNKELNELLKDDDTFRDGFLKKIIIREPDKTGRHSIANQWGAYRMAQVAGLDMTKFNYPKTLYFKYLLAQAKPPKPLPVHFPTVKKILFIDDNYQKGWKDCLEGLFGVRIEDEDAFESWDKAVEAKVTERLEKDEYDLVFLDFYLGEGDTIGKGKEVLEAIKGLNPVLPVIMFTASNKAWNMDKLYEAGADGYYVKEHPDNANDTDFSVENFKNFHETVKKCLEKGKLLRQYWGKIKDIETNSIIQNKVVSTNNQITEQLNRKRINERLTMFLGLLKKAYEQTHFDKQTFFYSEWELAFLTLWSTLNEIQEAYYEKVEGVENPKNSGIIESIHPDGTSIISKWRIRNQNDEFLWKEGIYSGFNLEIEDDKYKLEVYSKFKFDRNNRSFSITNNSLSGRGFYETRLFLQIAYLIKKQSDLGQGVLNICKKEVKKTNPNLDENLVNNLARNKVSVKEKSLLDLLLKVNEYRNHLYLTHGEDSSSPNFAQLYKDQRENTDWEKHIKQLFEIVYFLCKGEECAW